ncbi:MAG: flagellar motor protein, partial [Clostridiales bacterium]|nr:flagellar motor protein [Clostridiales bacterium]
MARRRKKSEQPSGGNWLDTYADMVTLLLTFFVLLYASSSIDEQKWQQILQAFESWGGYTNKIVT